MKKILFYSLVIVNLVILFKGELAMFISLVALMVSVCSPWIQKSLYKFREMKYNCISGKSQIVWIKKTGENMEEICKQKRMEIEKQLKTLKEEVDKLKEETNEETKKQKEVYYKIAIKKLEHADFMICNAMSESSLMICEKVISYQKQLDILYHRYRKEDLLFYYNM